MSYYQIGFGKADITGYERGMAMLGWLVGDVNRVHGVSGQLKARAMAISETSTSPPLVIVTLDICFITQLLRAEILDRLNNECPNLIRPHQILLSGTHSHSGPSGISDSLLLSGENLGISPAAIDAIVKGTVEAINQAYQNRRAMRLQWGESLFPLGMAVNRSLASYNANHDVAHASNRDQAVDRRVRVLRAEDKEGIERGLMAWVACHGTNIHSDNTHLDTDFPGRAMGLLEKERGGLSSNGDYIAMIMQGATGDVTPNIRQSKKHPWFIGPYDDDRRNADYVAQCIAESISTAIRLENLSEPVSGKLRAALRYEDMSRVDVDSLFTLGQGEVKTTVPILGMPATFGTAEGPGPLHFFRSFFTFFSDLRNAITSKTYDNKVAVLRLDQGLKGKLAGLIPLRYASRFIPSDIFRWWAALAKARTTSDRSLIPTILPAQILCIGDIIVATLPGEPTNQAGKRIERALLDIGSSKGMRRVLISGYSNAHSGYITTLEEYSKQRYEGGSTLFGPHTLGAWQTILTKTLHTALNVNMEDKQAFTGVQPTIPSRQQLLEEKSLADSL